MARPGPPGRGIRGLVYDRRTSGRCRRRARLSSPALTVARSARRVTSARTRSLSIIINYHDASRANLGSRSSRESRVAFFWSGDGHRPLRASRSSTRPAAIRGWCVKDAGGGRPPSDDVIVRCGSRDSWDIDPGRRRQRLFVPSRLHRPAAAATERLPAAAWLAALGLWRGSCPAAEAWPSVVQASGCSTAGVRRSRPWRLPKSPSSRPTPSTFYRSFSEKRLTSYGSSRRGRIERARLALLIAPRHAARRPARDRPRPRLAGRCGGPGRLALSRASRPARFCIDVLRAKGLEVIEAFTPPIPVADGSADVVYADQVLEHMSGIDAARAFVAEARRVLRPGRRVLRGGPRLSEGAHLLLGRRLHAQLRHHRAPRAPAAVRRRLRDRAHRAQHRRRRPGSGATSSPPRPCFTNVPGVDTLSRYTGDRRASCSRFARTCSKPSTFVAQAARS